MKIGDHTSGRTCSASVSAPASVNIPPTTQPSTIKPGRQNFSHHTSSNENACTNNDANHQHGGIEETQLSD